MPIKRRRNLHRKDDFASWTCTLSSGYDYFGDLRPDQLEYIDEHHGRSGPPRLDAAREAWDRHGARMLVEKAANPFNFSNGSLWAIWAFGPPADADPEALAVNLAQMKCDWNEPPDWPDRKQANYWLEQYRGRLAANARATGTVPEWVAEHFPDL